jgi:hypothetical protein
VRKIPDVIDNWPRGRSGQKDQDKKSPVAFATGLELFGTKAALPLQAQNILEVERVRQLPAHTLFDGRQCKAAIRVDAGRLQVIVLAEAPDIELNAPVDVPGDLPLVTNPGIDMPIALAIEGLVHIQTA